MDKNEREYTIRTSESIYIFIVRKKTFIASSLLVLVLALFGVSAIRKRVEYATNQGPAYSELQEQK